MTEKHSQTDRLSLSLNRGMHSAIMEELAGGTVMDLRKVSEPMRQRLIDLAMQEPPLVDVDADRVSITDAGRAFMARVALDRIDHEARVMLTDGQSTGETK